MNNGYRASSIDPTIGEIPIAAFRIGIVGAGPAGGILAAHLAKHGHRPIVCDIDEQHLEAIRSNGLEISGLREMVVRIPDLCPNLYGMKGRDVKVLFLAVKTPVLERIVPRIKKIFHDKISLISYQNGLGNEEFLASHFGEENVARMVLNYAGNLIGPGEIRMSFFTGSNYIGAVHPEIHELCKRLAALLTEVGLETEFTLDLKTREWEKTILNSALAPISAVTGLTMKDAMADKGIRSMVEETILECIAVAEAEGIKLVEGFLDKCMGYLDAAGPHKPSMLVDIECGRPTEIDFLNQRICEFGQRYGVGTPINAVLTGLVRGIERRCGCDSDRDS